MDLAFQNGTEDQQEQVRAAVRNLLHYDLSKAPGDTVQVRFVSDPEPSVHNEFAFSDEQGIALRDDFPNFAPTELWGSIQFAHETVIHEIAHQILGALDDAVRTALGDLFGIAPFLQGAEYDQENETKQWADRQREGFAETFKDAFLPSRSRQYGNRTNIKLSISKYPQFRALLRDVTGGSASGGIHLLIGGEEVLVRAKEDWGAPNEIRENEAFDVWRWEGFREADSTGVEGVITAAPSNEGITAMNATVAAGKPYVKTGETSVGAEYAYAEEDVGGYRAMVTGPGYISGFLSLGPAFVFLRDELQASNGFHATIRVSLSVVAHQEYANLDTFDGYYDGSILWGFYMAQAPEIGPAPGPEENWVYAGNGVWTRQDIFSQTANGDIEISRSVRPGGAGMSGLDVVLFTDEPLLLSTDLVVDGMVFASDPAFSYDEATFGEMFRDAIAAESLFQVEGASYPGASAPGEPQDPPPGAAIAPTGHGTGSRRKLRQVSGTAA